MILRRQIAHIRKHVVPAYSATAIGRMVLRVVLADIELAEKAIKEGDGKLIEVASKCLSKWRERPR